VGLGVEIGQISAVGCSPSSNFFCVLGKRSSIFSVNSLCISQILSVGCTSGACILLGRQSCSGNHAKSIPWNLHARLCSSSTLRDERRLLNSPSGKGSKDRSKWAIFESTT